MTQLNSGFADDALRQRLHMERLGELRQLVARLETMSPLGNDCYRAAGSAGSFDRLYGGRLLAEGMMAAAGTVENDRSLHSMHCHYLRVGDPSLDTIYSVERVHDTRTFSRRLVRAAQGERSIAIATYSFSASTGGISHQSPATEVPRPETLESRDVELVTRNRGTAPANSGVPWPFDIRHASSRPWDEHSDLAQHHLWLRTDERLADNAQLHASLLLYASDFAMPDAVTMRHPIRWEKLMTGDGVFGASLDHAFWLHKPTRIDQWLLHEQESTVAHDGRGFATGRFYDSSGDLIASVAQEVFIKTVGESA